MGLQFTILYILLVSFIEPAGLLQHWLQSADVGWPIWLYNLQHSIWQLVHNCVWCRCQWACSSVGQAPQLEYWSMYYLTTVFRHCVLWPGIVTRLLLDFRNITCLLRTAVLFMVWHLIHANFLLYWTSRCMFWISRCSGTLLGSGIHSSHYVGCHGDIKFWYKCSFCRC